MKIRWGRVLILTVTAGLIVALIRGCVMARRAGEAETQRPPGAVAVVRVYDTRAEALLTMPLEEYLVGVVAGEMPVSFPLEALKAQAVAARSYTVYHALRGGCAAHDADVCTSSACCQAHADEARLKERWGEDYEENEAIVRRAVTETAGELLLYDGEPIEALYHSASGGGTENVEDVYKNALPYLRAVESRAEAGSSRITGEKSLAAADFAALVNEKWPEAGLEAERLGEQIEILETTQSGRVQRVRLGRAEATGRQMRSLLSLDSALFTMELEDGVLTFHTRGYGHGVGMSQTGANVMALGGRSYREILLYYYTDVTLGVIAP
ncbi:MAG: stage II sporulation protein D [Clostridia bacterium]|nr:stage II sporulation protein D [Clostridia bacterium]